MIYITASLLIGQFHGNQKQIECKLYLIIQKHSRADVFVNKSTPDILPMALLDTENVPSDGTFVALMHKCFPTWIDNLGIDALCSL